MPRNKLQPPPSIARPYEQAQRQDTHQLFSPRNRHKSKHKANLRNQEGLFQSQLRCQADEDFDRPCRSYELDDDVDNFFLPRASKYPQAMLLRTSKKSFVRGKS